MRPALLLLTLLLNSTLLMAAPGGNTGHYGNDWQQGYPRGNSSSVFAWNDIYAYSGKKWEEMTPQEQDAVRRRKEQYESLPYEEQQRIRKAREQYQKLPEDKQDKLREKWEKMSPEEKKRYRPEKNTKR
jgi:hypothetical protein